jgi:hypothetical protein
MYGLQAAQASRTENIKIAPAVGGALLGKRISFSLFGPFNFLFSEAKKNQKCQKNQRIFKIRRKKSTSVPLADPWFLLYKFSKPFFSTVFQTELAAIE